jgi:hypothetical protein
MRRAAKLVAAVAFCVFPGALASADTMVFFENCQLYTLVASGVTSDTISSNGYLFTYTRDKLFTGGTGHPIGRPVRVAWPAGVEAQAVTTPPPGVTDYKARITLQRVDGQVFDLTAFTFQLLANTGGAGASLEIMPVLNGEDGFADPVYFNATGYYGQTFSYDTSPNPMGSTALLTGFDTYKIGLYVDFALIGATFNSGSPGLRSCCLPNDSCVDLTATSCVLQGGAPLGAGTSCACNPCVVPQGPPPVPDGRNATTPLRAARLTAGGDSIQLDWDAASCPAIDYNLIYGDLSGVAGYALSGFVCSTGTSGGYVWAGVPSGDLYFLVVGTDGAGTESSWGLNGANQERNGSVASGTCGATSKRTSQTCP